MNARTILAVAVGGALGALVRAGLLNDLVAQRSVALVAINAAGSFLLGVLATRLLDSPTALAATGTGFCGALTSMSTFAVDVAQRLQDGQLASALVLAGVTLLFAFGGALAGLRFGESA